MDWPTAFLAAVVFGSLFGWLAYQDHLRAEIMKEAIRKGWGSMKFE